MTKDQIIDEITNQFSDEELKKFETLTEAEKVEFGEYMKKHVLGMTESLNRHSEQLVKLAVREGVNVDGSKGVQFLIGVCAGLMVRIEQIEKQVGKHEEHLSPKIVAAEAMERWRKAAREKMG